MSRIKRYVKQIFNVIKLPFFKIINAAEIYFLIRRKKGLADGSKLCPEKSVLVLGIYMANKKNVAAYLAEEFAKSKSYKVTQAWLAIGDKISENATLREMTRRVIKGRVPKFSLLNELLAEFNLDDFDYLVITDDDVVVERGFIDKYICLQERVGFSLAQPARTRFSELSHDITKTKAGVIARETRFVEIGPIFSFARKVFPDFLPFDESSPMGWGYDFVWPVVIAKKALTMGIIDATPVNHSIRPTNQFYSGAQAGIQMDDFLSKHKHLTRAEAYLVLDTIHQ